MKELRTLALTIREALAERGPEVLDWVFDELDPGTVAELSQCWQMYARQNQMRPLDSKSLWMMSAGRGSGKTRAAAEETLDFCEDVGATARVILASKTIGDVRKVMIAGESGLQICALRRGYELRYVSSHSMCYHPSGAELYLVTSEKPDMARGLQANFLWLDEISSWMNPIECFDNILFAWRLPCAGGKRGIITTTPKPNAISRRLMQKMTEQVTVTFGKTSDNAANLDAGTVELLESLYRGTRLGQQELDGILLEGNGATVSQDTIHTHRLQEEPTLSRRIVSLDPSITDGEDSDAAGIIVLGCDAQRIPHAYVLADRTLERAKFSDWAKAAVDAFVDYDCDCIVAEVNQGGCGIEEAIQVAADHKSRQLGFEIVVPVRSIWARKSKKARAEPVGALYERGRIHHVGFFAKAEKELTEWVPGEASPNRLDAIVHGVSHLLLSEKTVGPIGAYLL